MTASLCPWKESWAWAIPQYGMKLPGVTRSFLSEYTRTFEKKYSIIMRTHL